MFLLSGDRKPTVQTSGITAQEYSCFSLIFYLFSVLRYYILHLSVQQVHQSYKLKAWSWPSFWRLLYHAFFSCLFLCCRSSLFLVCVLAACCFYIYRNRNTESKNGTAGQSTTKKRRDAIKWKYSAKIWSTCFVAIVKYSLKCWEIEIRVLE